MDDLKLAIEELIESLDTHAKRLADALNANTTALNENTSALKEAKHLSIDEMILLARKDEDVSPEHAAAEEQNLRAGMFLKEEDDEA